MSPGGALNPGLLLRSQVSYPLDHKGIYMNFECNIHCVFNDEDTCKYFLWAMKYIKFQCAPVFLLDNIDGQSGMY